MRCLLAITLLAVLMVSARAHAQDDASSAELAKKLQNPIANLISVPPQSDCDFGIGRAQAMRYTLDVQPVIPFSLGKD